jgi:hypothetical protein
MPSPQQPDARPQALDRSWDERTELGFFAGEDDGDERSAGLCELVNHMNAVCVEGRGV